jgi:ATP/maltotriose-dependent transcriptional regulator MalT
LLLRAAKRLEPLDARLARETYLDALSAAVYLGRLAGSAGLAEVAQAALAAPRPHPSRPSDLLLDGLATRFTGGYTTSAPMLKRALSAYPSHIISSEEALRWLWLALQAAVDLWDDQMWEVLTSRHVQLGRETGALTILPFALSARSGAYTFAGELTAAASLIEEVETIGEAIGSHFPPYAALALLAWQGREAKVSELVEATTKEALARGEDYGLSGAQWANAVLNNGLGRYRDALAAAELATQHPEDLVFYNWGLVELIVAAVRSGKPELAADPLDRLSDIAHASGSDWALGIEARSRALMSEGEAAERLHLEAIKRLGRTRIRVELARSHLLYGEWLRRERRHLNAREQLRTAYELFTRIGAEAFAERARRELLATGETVSQRTVQTARTRSGEAGGALTVQEAQIARMARDGLSNPEIGTRLFISARTVQYHLRKVFAKLGVSSRSQLYRVLPNGAAAVQPS